MKRVVYQAGRALQIVALGALPFAIWVGHIGHDERGSLIILISSVLIFTAGYALTRLAPRM